MFPEMVVFFRGQSGGQNSYDEYTTIAAGLSQTGGQNGKQATKLLRNTPPIAGLITFAIFCPRTTVTSNTHSLSGGCSIFGFQGILRMGLNLEEAASSSDVCLREQFGSERNNQIQAAITGLQRTTTKSTYK